LAQVNYWTNTVSGYWEDTYWSLGIPPGTNQSIVLANEGWKALAIGPSTVQKYPNSLNVGTVTISSPSNSFNLLLLNYMGFEKPLTAKTITVNSNATLTVLASKLEITNAGSSDYRLEVGGTINQGESAIVNTSFLSLGNVGAGVYNLTNGSLIVNTGYVAGSYDGLIRQFGGTNSVTALRLLGPYHYPLTGKGEYDLYDGVLTGAVELYFGGTFKQTGGTFNGSLRFDGIYELEGGFFTSSNMDIPATWDDGGTVVQTGGTNHLVNLTLSAEGGNGYRGGYAGGEYVLSNGVLIVTAIRVGPQSTLWQAGGVLTNQGVLSLVSGAGTIGAYPYPQGSEGRLDGGWMGTGSLDLYGASFVQTGGTNQVSGAASIESIYQGPGVGTAYGNYTLNNGLFFAPSVVIRDGGEFTQSGGTVLTETLSLTRPAGWGSGPPGKTFCDLSGGQLVVSNMQIRGVSVVHHTGGSLLHQGLLTFAGGLWDEHTPRQQLGPLQLSFTNNYADGSNSTLSLATNGCLIRFADSSAFEWSTNAFLTISNWNGSTNGGGMHQVIFGTNSRALTAPQLSQILFVQPNVLSGTFPARLLGTGEVVPDTGTPAPPAISPPMRQGDGAMMLVVNGDLGRVYGVAVSTDLFHWYPWSNQISHGGPMTFLDGEAPNYPRRLYRAFVQP
jgi:hypothetical protein